MTDPILRRVCRTGVNTIDYRDWDLVFLEEEGEEGEGEDVGGEDEPDEDWNLEILDHAEGESEEG